MKLDIDKEIVLKFLGYGKRKVPEIIEKKIDEEIEKCANYITPEYQFVKTPIDTSEDTVLFDNSVRVKSSYIYKKLRGLDSAYVLIYTVGSKIEEVIDYYSNHSDMMRAVIIDKIGVVALDDLREKVLTIIEEKESPLKVSSVSYPGQGDFGVEMQGVFFDFFKESGSIKVNEFSQFHPIKTVLLVLGIGDEKDKGSMCDECDNPCEDRLT